MVIWTSTNFSVFWAPFNTHYGKFCTAQLNGFNFPTAIISDTESFLNHLKVDSPLFMLNVVPVQSHIRDILTTQKIQATYNRKLAGRAHTFMAFLDLSLVG